MIADIALGVSIWCLFAVFIVASRVGKLNRHHHGGFTRGNRLGFDKVKTPPTF